jgi:HPt (histidine-containing phosphotransfer) domain-containing protein
MPGQRRVVTADAELADLIPGYLENRGRDVGTISEALEQGDYQTIQRLGHSMKGSGGGYGFDAITELGGLLEKAADDSDDKKINYLVYQLKEFLDSLEVVYE